MVKKTFIRVVLPALVILLAYGVYAYLRPVPAITPVTEIVTVPKTQAISLPWPASGQAAIGAAGYGVLDSHNAATPVPIASVSKVITALAVLKQKPVSTGSQGETITLGSPDVDLFNYYYSKDGSVAQVNSGEQLTEVQALQTMLIPSANNMADSLAVWAFGSVNGYVAYANKMVKDMGLKDTTVGDASGFGDVTTSTADDLVRLGIVAIQNPVLAQIVAQPSAQVPVAGSIKNLNLLLGQDGVIGIKTGNTDHAGGCYLFASQRTIAGQPLIVVGAVLGQPSLTEALKSATPIIRASDTGFAQTVVLHKGQTLGYYQVPWGSAVQFKAGKDVIISAWKGQDIKIQNKADNVSSPMSSGASVGAVTATSGDKATSSNLVLSRVLPSPPWTWRLFH
ncbi:MAG TPA: serine hydrolase [Candidatus Babeliales bacterium]|nr:serine hydrolase [Candidatus Babeliales bacterium]